MVQADPYAGGALRHAIVMTTCVGVIVGGPYEGKKMVGCSLAVNRDGICKQASYNEFASELVAVDLTITAAT